MHQPRSGAQTRLRALYQCVQSQLERLGPILVLLAMVAGAAAAQSAPEDPGPEDSATNASVDDPQPIPPGPIVTVHGLVRNALSGDPLARTLVQVDGETGPGILTDGDGRFDLSLPGLGSHVFQLTKPGF